MSAAPTNPPASADRSPRAGSRALRRGLYAIIGLLLLGAAIVAVVRSGPAAGEALRAAQSAPAWMIALACLLPLVNLAAVSLSFSLPTSRYGQVGIGEMFALISGAWLLNMLPLGPGKIGRIAYHKTINHIPVRASILVLFQVLACNIAAMALVLGCVLAASRAGLSSHSLVPALAAPLAILIGAAAAMRLLPAHSALRRTRAWIWPATIALRYVDLAAWTARYSVGFAALGKPMTLLDSTVVALASEAAMLSPVQVGLREWVVGLVSGALDAGGGWGGVAGGGSRLADVSQGLLVDLINRGIELLILGPIGLISVLWVLRRLRSRSHSPRTLPEQAPASGRIN